MGYFCIFALAMKEKNLNTIIDLLERSCSKFPDNVYLWEKRDGKYQPSTYSEVKQQVMYVAAGMMAVGLEKGDRVALLSEGCNAWVYGELGLLYAGGTNVPLSIKLTPKEVVFRVNHSGARYLIVSDFYVNTIRQIEDELTSIEKIFVIRPSHVVEGKYVSFDQLLSSGKVWMEKHPGEVEKRASSVEMDDLANISYTSGTTAEPKGIMLTHGNYVSNVLQSDSLIQVPEYFKVLLFLPWDHSFAHTVGIYSFMYNGASLAYVDFGRSPMEYLRNITLNMKEVKPHLLLSVPALAKNFKKNIEAGIQLKGKFVQWLYNKGLKVAYRYYGTGNHEGKGMRIVLYPLVKLVDILVFKKIRDVFGGNLRFFIGGGALLDIELQRYFCALGVPMLQGYGLSEASPVISSNRPQLHHFGSSGQIVRPMDLKICDDSGNELPRGEKGEIVIRGGNVMKGYWKNPTSTAESLRDGWLYTGDMGYVNEEGLLYVLGRFKSLLIASDGEKYSPEGIEEAIMELSPSIDYCVLYNNQSSYTAGLIVPNKAALREYVLKQHVTPESVEGYKLMLDKIYGEILRFRKGGEFEGMFPERWLPAVIAILPETLCEANGTVNSTAKVVRHKVYEYFKEEIDFVYTPEGKDVRNPRNTQNIKQVLTGNTIR